jgi:DNA-binding LytR/AlgR family response regulator
MQHTALFVRLNGMFRPIPFNDILYISASRNYSEIATTSKGKISICIPLGEVEEQLLENLFCRIHRSYIISVQQISGYTYTDVYVGEKRLPLGKTYLESFMARTIRVQCCRDRQLEEEMKRMSLEEYVKKFSKTQGKDGFSIA